MLVRDVLRAKYREIVTIVPEDTVDEALALLVSENIGSLPVLDSGSRLVGIFTERDLLRGLHEDRSGFLREPIHEVMTRNPVTCGPDDEVHEVMGKMSRHQVGQLPVLAGRDVIGVVSVGDLIKLLYDKTQMENQELRAYLYGPG
jgi:CBS domain-containing protein